MLTIISAVALAAAQPPAAHPSVPGNAHSEMGTMEMGQGQGQADEHKSMDCCKNCKGVAGKHDGQGSEHSDHGSH